MHADKGPLESTTDQFERLAEQPNDSRLVLKLYVSGMTPRSTEAIHNLAAICDKYLRGRHELEIIDVYKDPDSTAADQVIATPMLVKKSPLPLRRFVGTLANEARVLEGLNLRAR